MRREDGFALAGTLLLLVVLTALGVAAWQTSREELSVGRSVRASARAFYASEAGLSATAADWDQAHYDTLLSETGDSTVVGWTTLANGCRYRVTIHRTDDGGGIDEERFYVATSVGRCEGQATISGTLRADASLPPNALSIGGDITFANTPTITGACGDIHSNGDISASGTVSVTEGAEISASGAVSGETSFQEPDGDPASVSQNQPVQEIRDLGTADLCGEADFRLVHIGGDPHLIDLSVPDTTDISSSSAHGWTWRGSPDNRFENDGTPSEGVVCAEDDVFISGVLGSSGSPVTLSVVTAGSFQIQDGPFASPAHSEDVMFLAEGDVVIKDDPATGGQAIDGLVYAGAQCELADSPTVGGNLVCRNGSNPAVAQDWATQNRIADYASVTYECGTALSQRDARLLGSRPWTQLSN